MTNQLTDRIDEGETLYFELSSDAHDCRVVACSPGAVEVAYPVAYLVGDSLIELEPSSLAAPTPMPRPGTARFRRWAQAILPVPDPQVPLAKAVLLIDDGLLTTDLIVSVACSLRNAGTKRLIVAAPWFRPDALQALRSVADRVYPARQRPEPGWYARPADPSRAAGLLADVGVRRHREEEAGPPDRGRATEGVVGPPAGLAEYLRRGVLVPYAHVRAGGRYGEDSPRGHRERLEFGGRMWEIEELYCPVPSCPCVEVVLTFEAFDFSDDFFAARIYLDGRPARIERLRGISRRDAAAGADCWKVTKFDAVKLGARHVEVKGWAASLGVAR